MQTFYTLLGGLVHQLRWWLRALVRWRDPRAPMTPRRLLVLLAGGPLFLAIQLGHVVCLLLDEVLFPAYRRTPVERPLFITGIPRSGTTFVHRTLAGKGETFTTVTTWEALLAPSILQRRLVGLLARVDRAVGRPGARALEALTDRLAGGMAAIHPVGLTAAEEDYLLLLPAAGCFLPVLALPGEAGAAELGRLDTAMSPGRRARLLHLYRRLLQRHLYADGTGRRLLSKNAAFGGWVAGLRETFPEARFLLCIREPGTALSSQISSVGSAGRLFGTATGGEAFQRLFLENYRDTLDHLARMVALWPTETVTVIDMADLRAAPGPTLAAALARLGEVPAPALAARLAALPAGGASGHHHRISGLALPATELAARLDPPYRHLLQQPHRIGSPP
ncbi:sulfotransferase [Thiohalospira sp.]|uniref:sulfotransferase n=1 Tax=Thiohalospira sp. TaxID=3080549 RepID=UPI00397F9C9F